MHIGLVQLSTDHTLETAWSKLIRDQAMVFSSRVYYSSVMTREALNDISKGITRAAGLIATGLPMDVMAFGCTSAATVIGSDKIKGTGSSGNAGNPPWRSRGLQQPGPCTGIPWRWLASLWYATDSADC